MKKQWMIGLLLLLGGYSFTSAQNSLSEQLWERVKNCNLALEDMDDDGMIDYETFIDDSKNGYLSISGSYPTCGCSCSSTVGAFKTAKGAYVFLDQSYWSCSWEHQISSNRPLNALFPSNLEKELFGENEKSTDRAFFYLSLKIPQFGTLTEVEIKTIPFGLKVATEGSLITYGYSQEKNVETYASYQIEMISRDCEHPETIEHLLNRTYDQIDAGDMELIQGVIKKNDYDDSRFASIEDISLQMNLLKRAYEAYGSLQYDKITLGWDKSKEQFYIKSKDRKPMKMSFKEFIEEMIYWSPIC